MSKKKQRKPHRSAGRQKKRQATPTPSEEDVNHWLNFVLYAVVGRMNEADQLMRRYADGIVRTARWLMSVHPVRVNELYRGILIEPPRVKGGRLHHEPDRTWLSFSEDKEVACWFADPRSVISAFVRHQRPSVQGYFAHASSPPGDVLWHHDWTSIRLAPDLHPISLVRAAAIHPDIDANQFAWNARTQREVIVRSPQTAKTFHVAPVSRLACGDVEELDARYTYPPFLRERYGA